MCLLCPAPALAVRASAMAGDLDAVLAACDRVRDVALPKVRQCVCVCLGRREHSRAWHYWLQAGVCIEDDAVSGAPAVRPLLP